MTAPLPPLTTPVLLHRAGHLLMNGERLNTAHPATGERADCGPPSSHREDGWRPLRHESLDRVYQARSSRTRVLFGCATSDTRCVNPPVNIYINVR
ncbi:hypothetical protein GCM10025762_41830 [Haloechinothrix salitolerans]